MITPYEVGFTQPDAHDFVELRQLVGWRNMTESQVRVSLDASLFHVTCYQDDTLVAMGRVVGDGIMYFYVQDVVVHPAHQGEGLGARIMGEIERYLNRTVHAGATVGLLAAHGKEGFYEKYGYERRTGEQLGLGMCKFI